MSINSILNMASTAMTAQQMGIQVASQNISNAETTGYSRQSVQLGTALPTVFPYGSVGTGVDIESITRSRDTLLDTTYRQASSGSSSASTTSDALNQIQSILGEPSDTGLSATLDQFWSAWSDLSSNPTDSSAKSVVLEAGQNVANTLNSFASQLDSLDQNNRGAMNADVNTVNSLANQVATYNNQIVSAQSNGQPANDLLDARDNILDQLSGIVGGQVVQHANGSAAVYVGGNMLVDGTSVKPLTMNDGEPPTVTQGTDPTPISGIGGSLGAEMTMSATTIPGVMSQLDSLTQGLVQTVNSIHNGATVFTGNPAVASTAGNFFDVTNPPPAGGDPKLTARGIEVDPTLTADGVAASGAGATGPGNNDVALAMAQLQTSTVSFTSSSGAPLGTMSIDDFYNQTVGNVATATQQAQDDSTVQSTLQSNADTRRQSVSGVSTDEELVNIIQYQHAYQAAARLVSVVNAMADTLVTLGE
ncbi:MAG TPA: flagellar hook-associated protein FlgK [Gemmatimonadaceae bacterium]|jgi:flagellar hook-associated protein 1 FlgK|nr:flagellar hook-associated protein FlgK [Gemmatimonadaceae bacterium]